jgi:predicted DNA-binding transcriptional regulator YafY
MASPTTRVLTVLELLQTHGRMSGSELSRRLEVGRRTIRRYIVKLEELGIPVTAERGRDGAYMLVAGYKLPPMMFTDDEVLAVSVGLLAARGLGLAGAATAVASAQAKLERVMPVNLKRRVRAVDETVTLELSRPTAPADNSALAALAAAARSQVRVRLRYAPPKRPETERDFDPYGLAYRSGRWYVVGMCHLRRGLRSFRLDRVLSVRPLEIGFSRPEGFDSFGYLKFSVATLPRAFTVEALLETDLATARRELFPAAGIIEWVGDGVLLRSQVDDLDWFARELTRLPFPFQIRRPAALRDAVAAHARRLLASDQGSSLRTDRQDNS